MVATKSKAFSGDFYLGLSMPVLVAAWFIPAALFRSWVLTVLWGWYIVPAFGLNPLRMVFAFGVAIIVTMLTMRTSSYNKKSVTEQVALSFAGPAFCLLYGWIGSFFVLEPDG